MAKALSSKEEAFAQHLAVHNSGPAAYCHAYNVRPDTTPATISAEASRMRHLPKITARVKEIRAAADLISPVTMSLAELIEFHTNIVNADPNEFIEIKRGACRYCFGDDHRYQFYEDEYLDLVIEAEQKGRPLPDVKGGFGYRHFIEPHPDCPRCGGRGLRWTDVKPTESLSDQARAAFMGVEEKKDGLKVSMADRAASARELARLQGMGGDTLTVKGQIGLAAALATVQAATPNDAAAAYEQFVKAGLALGPETANIVSHET